MTNNQEIVSTGIILGAIPEETRATWNAMMEGPNKQKAKAALLAQIRAVKKDLGIQSVQEKLDEINAQNC